MVTRGYGGREGINWEIGTDIDTLLYIKQTTKNLLYSPGDSAQYSVGAYVKRILKKWTFSGSLVLKTWPSSAAGAGSIPDLWQGARTPHASRAKTQRKKEAIL